VALRTVGVRLTADVSQYMSNLKRAGAATKDFGGGNSTRARRQATSTPSPTGQA
jgi:hypothetical protein